MATDFVQLGDALVATMVEPDPVKRELAVEAWLDSAVPVLQAGLRERLREYIHETVNKGVSKTKAQRYFVRLTMQFNLERAGKREKLQVPRSVFATNQPPPQNTTGDDGSDDSAKGRTPNDDRSDSMNPNNPGHQAAKDNRSDQMNPNNPAYWDSRGGRGR